MNNNPHKGMIRRTMWLKIEEDRKMRDILQNERYDGADMRELAYILLQAKGRGDLE